METASVKRCIALYSGGLDSILAIRLLERQSFEVAALYFCTPYFGLDALLDPEAFEEKAFKRYGVRVKVVDFTEDMAAIIRAPRHGYGKHLNPCIDCKIGMLRRARGLLETENASFVVTGEVVGQRPMSQRGQVMRLIERESGLEDILLRPLCARLLPPTAPERAGIVDRASLGGIRGRGRKVQMEMARELGIAEHDMPSPAGGCLLTDEQIARKAKITFDSLSPALPSRADLLLDVVGRRFRLKEKTVLVVGRNEQENALIARFVHPGNVFMRMRDVPSPLCILRGEVDASCLETAAAVCLRYTKARGEPGHVVVHGERPDDLANEVAAPVVDEEFVRKLQD
ncbi:MAG TPA: hypothetical protein PLS81_03025 [Deltaproteobacteria bacterium]|nr:hypothetical protein [Deltaproteobacteria bacterium]HPP80448.1 hypothetical protein [Deltaproteobacteria bacterium]